VRDVVCGWTVIMGIMLSRPMDLGLPMSPAELQGPQNISPHPLVALDLSAGPPAEAERPTGSGRRGLHLLLTSLSLTLTLCWT